MDQVLIQENWKVFFQYVFLRLIFVLKLQGKMDFIRPALAWLLSGSCPALARLLPGSCLALAQLLPGSCPALARLLPGSCPALVRLLPALKNFLLASFEFTQKNIDQVQIITVI
jgi:hypothetical protein